MGVRHNTSNLRIVFRSIPSTLYRSVAVSWIAAITLLRYFFRISILLRRLYLEKSSVRHSFRHLRIAIAQHNIRQLSEGLQLIRLDIAEILLLEAVHKYGSPLKTVEDDGSRSTRLPFTRPGDTLLDNTAAQISIDYTCIDQTRSFPKIGITDAGLARKATELLGFVYGQLLRSSGAHM